MKRFLWILTAVLWLTAVSCSPATVEEASPTPADNDGALLEAPLAEPDVFPRATLTPPPVEPETTTDNQTEAGYPAPPPASTFPEGYPGPTPPPAINPYPEATGSLIWILKPVGEQCAETPPTPDLQTAVADMVAFGIPVEASEMTDLPVCSACGCPTSVHFRLQIDSGYLGNAEVLGWFAEE
ncbi:MAG: hypothetical protein DHS20C20_24770 [Ardenticatenaceae bacterium]|nr:MAG: hypothetical protein DHS20C20_24770 [Ardenticatenaceae bacterium]